MAQNKYLVVLDEIKPNSPERLQPLKLLAEYLSAPSKRENVLSQLDQKLSNASTDNDILVLVAAIIYMKEQNYEGAYRVLHTVETLEAMAFIVDILLKLDRVDLARKKLKEMQEKDDDATLTQIVQAWVNIALVCFATANQMASKPSRSASRAIRIVILGRREAARRLLHLPRNSGQVRVYSVAFECAGSDFYRTGQI